MRKTTYLPPRGNVVSTPRLQILICIVLFLPFWSAAPTRGPSASREGPIVGLAPEVKIKGVIKLLSIIVNQQPICFGWIGLSHAENTVGWFGVREKYYSLADKP